MLKWKYGSYQFTINPNAQSSQIDLVGDVARTLSGALISQPTALQESYSVSSVFYQHRSQPVSQVSLPNASLFESYSGNFYALNKTNSRIDVYNELFVSNSSISLSAVTNSNYGAFDTQPNYIWVASDNSSYGQLETITYSGVSGSTYVLSTGNAIIPSGLEILNSYVYVLRPTGKIDKYRSSDLGYVTTLTLPSGVNYYGMTSDGTYLIVGNNDNYSKIYHVDPSSGTIVNQIAFNEILSISDVAYDGNRFYNLSGTNLQVIKGNTVDLDVINIRNQITSYKYVDLIDDMGVTTRVTASDFSTNRKIGYDHYYEVSMNISKVNRG